MKKADLRTGMTVQLRNGKHYIVMRGTGMSGSQDDVFVARGGGFMPLYDYNDDMTCKPYTEEDFIPLDHDASVKIASTFDVMKVYEPSEAGAIGDIKSCKLVFDRNGGDTT